MQELSPQDAGQAKPRMRLIEAATRLFCRNGIAATGIDAIVAEAGTAKTTLYKIFKSKNDLIAAVLQAEDVRWRAWFLAAVADPPSPRDKLDAIFPALKKRLGEENYTGSIFINAVGEHPRDEARLRELAIQHKSFIINHIRDFARAAGAAGPDIFADQIGMLIDGAVAAAMVTRSLDSVDAAGRAAAVLLDAACASAKPKRVRTVGLQGGAAALAKEDLSVVE